MSPGGSRWIKPEIYPLLAPVILAVGLCGFALTRKVVGDPGITFSKEARAHGMSDDEKAGELYKFNPLRSFVKGHPAQIMPGLNRYFGGAKE